MTTTIDCFVFQRVELQCINTLYRLYRHTTTTYVVPESVARESLDPSDLDMWTKHGFACHGDTNDERLRSDVAIERAIEAFEGRADVAKIVTRGGQGASVLELPDWCRVSRIMTGTIEIDV